MSKSKSTIQFTQLSPEEITFDKVNPRFAGMDVQPDDPTPYGESIDKMFQSMVEMYKSTGKLLLQPAGVDKNGNVRFGYTRLMTFVTRYDDLCQELGVDELKIDVQYFNKIDESEALAENLRRTEQHFLATGYTIMELRKKKHSYKSLVGKLGMSVKRIKALETLPELHPKLQQYCYDNVINERAAVILASKPMSAQTLCVAYLEKEGDVKVLGVDAAEKLVRYVVPELSKHTPTQAFVDLDGKEWPAIKEEDWAFTDNDLLETIYVLDVAQEVARRKAYWESVAEGIKIWDKEEYLITCSDAYVKCEMGTHPSEIGVWSDDETYLNFYVKRTELKKIKDPESYVEDKVKKINEQTNNKIVRAKNEAKVALMKELMEDLVDEGSWEGVNILYALVIQKVLPRLGKNARAFLDKLMGDKVTEKNILEFDTQVLVEMIGMSMLYSDNYVYSDHKAFFKANGMDFNRIFDDQVKVDLDKKLVEIKSKGQSLEHSIKDKMDDREIFVQEMHEILVLKDLKSLFEHIIDRVHVEPKFAQYAAKKLGMPKKGNPNMLGYRVGSAVSMIQESFEADYPEGQEKLVEFLKAVSTKGRMLNEMYQAHDLNNEIVSNGFRELWVLLCEHANDMDIEERKVSIPVVLKAAATGKGYGEAMVLEFLTVYAHIIKSVWGMKLMHLNDKGKVCILG